jgi:hypothetical protein
MRVFLAGALCATLIGCACPAPTGRVAERCTATGCVYRAAVVTPAEPKRVALRRASSAAKHRKVAKTDPPPVAKPRNEAQPVQEKASAPVVALPAPQPAIRPAGAPEPAPEKKTSTTTGARTESSAPAEMPDPVLKRAMSTTAAKLDDPASAAFDDMKRATRKDTFGLPIDSICGHVRGKKTSGEDTGARPFLYVVKEDKAFIDDGRTNSVAGIAYRAICTGAESR